MYEVFGHCLSSQHTVLVFQWWLKICLFWCLWQSSCMSANDGTALLSIKASVELDPAGLLSDWKDGTYVCRWKGVGCDSVGNVISLNITGLASDARSESFADANAAVCRASPACSSSEAYSQLSNQSGEPQASSNRASVANDTATRPCFRLRGTLSPAVGKLLHLRFFSLPFNGFSGEIPKEISALRSLELLDIQGNEFSGAIPGVLGQLSELRTLNLAFNRLEGVVPQEIAGCKKLKYINLEGNRLSGELPRFFGSMPYLQAILMSSNKFDGIIPLELTKNCTSLEQLHLGDNFLSGGIPTGFSRCSHLQSFMVSSNLLSGPIPADFGQLQELQVVDVSCNALGSDIPLELAHCSQLSVLVLANSNTPPSCQISTTSVLDDGVKGEFNYFSSLPSKVVTIPTLRILWAPGAALGGVLPSSWGSCESLEVLNLAGNSLTGFVSEGLVECKHLIYLDLSDNKLEGMLPSMLSIQCMVVFNVSGNNLTGSLLERSEGICLRSMLLESLFLSSPVPHLSGNAMGTLISYFSSLYCGVILSRIPAWFSNGKIVVVHDMSNNNFTGPLHIMDLGEVLLEKAPAYGFFVSSNHLVGALSSSFFDSCQRLGSLSFKVSSNKFTGMLPADTLVKCIPLRQLEAADNQLVGIIPNGLGKLKQLVYLDLSFNRLTGELPSELGQLHELQYLMLAGNNLTGQIPEDVGRLTALLVLDLASNNFTGSIPGDLANLSNLKKLFLSRNRLSGRIPRNLTRLKNLSVMDVAFNNLSSTAPHTGRLSLCTTNSTVNSELLKSCSLSSPAPSNEVSAEPFPYANHHRPNSIMIAAITSGCAIAAVLVILVLLFHCTRHEKRVQVRNRAGRKNVVVFRRLNFHLTYENVVAATGHFSINNLIGNGGFGATYRAELMPGFFVAVKRLSLGRFQGTKQFQAEICTLGSIQHPNLVTLIGYHASETEMFLIYNYLPGGNLESLIHTRKGFVSWRVRYKIALNIAQALAYLHDECTPRVLHRDIKPSNVLLDNNLNAFLSDFGLARLLSASETHATTDVAGTFGYVAPEYAMTCRVSEKADVYSYGVVLLELLCGKKALDPYFSNYGHVYDIVSWASQHHHKGKLPHILAPGLWEQGPQSELLAVLKLAVRCTMRSLSVRPTMNEVVEALKAL